MRAARRFLGTISFPLLVLTIGIIATGLATDQVRRSVAAADRERFDFAADRLQDSIQDRVNMYVAMLRAGAGLLAAAEIHSPEQFRAFVDRRSEEHTSELQSHVNLVCRLLLEKKKKKK